MIRIETILQKSFTYTAYVLVFCITIIVGLSSFLYISEIVSPQQASAITLGDTNLNGSDSIMIDKKFIGQDGTGGYIQDRVNVSPGGTVTVLLYYNNSGEVAVQNAQIRDTIPAGFSYVPGSLENCIIPTVPEQTCFSLSDTLVNSTTVTVSPSAGYYDQALSAASGGTATNANYGYLMNGRKRYFNLHNCAYYNSTVTSYFNTYADLDPHPIDFTNFDAPPSFSNEPVQFEQCGSGGGSNGYVEIGNWSHVENLDLLNKRYVNLHKCAYFYATDDSWFSTYTDVSNALFNSGTNAANTTGSLSCGPGDVNYSYASSGSGIDSIDLVGNRYFNLHHCSYQNTTTFANFTNISRILPLNGTTNYEAYTNTSFSVPDTTANCGPGNATFTPNTAWFEVNALDMADVNRGRGYIQYQLTAPTTPGSYGSTVELRQASAGGSNFISASATDAYIPDGENEIEVLTNVQYSATSDLVFWDGTSEVSSLDSIEPNTAYTVRAKYANTGYADLTNASLTVNVPSGFTINSSSFRTCLTPSATESSCSATYSPGGSVLSGNTITASPIMRRYDQGVNTTTPIGSGINDSSGLLPIGKKRYIKYFGCNALGFFTESFSQDQSFFHTSNDNTFTEYCDDTSIVNNPYPYPYTGNLTETKVTEDITNQRYLTVVYCESSRDLDTVFDYRQVEIISFNNSGTTTANALTECNNSANVGTGDFYTLNDYSHATYDIVGNRFFSRMICQSSSNLDDDLISSDMVLPDGVTFFHDIPPTFTQDCNNLDTAKTGVAGGNTHTEIYERQDTFDLLDTDRGGGYIEFQVTSPSSLSTFTNYTFDYTLSSTELTLSSTSATATYDPMIFTGTAYRDENGNEIYDAGTDTVLPGVEVTLTTDINTYVDTTDGSGNYSFNVAEPTSYTLAITNQPIGFSLVTENVGANDAIDSDFDDSNGQLPGSPIIVVPPVTINEDYDAIFQYLVDLEITSVTSGGGSSIVPTVGQIIQGDTMYYDITVKNLGNSLTNTNGTISFTSNYDSGDLTYSSYSAPAGWTCTHTAPNVTCSTTNSLQGGDSDTIRLNFNVN